MPEERLVTISSSSHLAPDDVARHTFATVRRGFDPDEVRAYLESLAAGLRGLAEREQQLLDELADAEDRAANPVLDEATLDRRAGQRDGPGAPQRPRRAAEMVAKAEAEANRLLSRGPGGDPAEPGPNRGPAGRAGGGHRGRRRRAPGADRAAGGRRHGEASGRPRRCWSRPASSAGPWSRRPRGSGPGCWPTCPSAARSSTRRSSSSGPAANGWPRRSMTCAGRSTPSPTTSSPPRTKPDWPPRPPAGRRLERPDADSPEELAARCWPRSRRPTDSVRSTSRSTDPPDRPRVPRDPAESTTVEIDRGGRGRRDPWRQPAADPEAGGCPLRQDYGRRPKRPNPNPPRRPSRFPNRTWPGLLA